MSELAQARGGEPPQLIGDLVVTRPPVQESSGMLKQIVCDCGWTARGTEIELLAAAQAHGREAHGLVPTREQVLAVATPVTGGENGEED